MARPNVWSVGDLGDRAGYALIHGFAARCPPPENSSPSAIHTGPTAAWRPGTAGRRCTCREARSPPGNYCPGGPRTGKPSALNVRSRSHLVGLAHPSRKLTVQVLRRGHTKLMHEQALHVWRNGTNARILSAPLATLPSARRDRRSPGSSRTASISTSSSTTTDPQARQGHGLAREAPRLPSPLHLHQQLVAQPRRAMVSRAQPKSDPRSSQRKRKDG
jgi:hypothetical protein